MSLLIQSIKRTAYVRSFFSFRFNILVFSNHISSDHMDRLASSDKRESVQHLYTFYADYLALDRQLFVIPTSVLQLLRHQWGSASLERIVDGLISVFCAVKKRPIIRYQV
jgi:vacuolar protein sorting-associated protein 45